MELSLKQLTPGRRASPGPRRRSVRLKAGEPFAYVGFYAASLGERVQVVKAGVPAQLLKTMAGDMHVSHERLYGWAGISPSTAKRKLKENDLLSQDESERVLGIASLVGQVQTVVAESGNPEGFDAARWTAGWLEEPNAALGGRPPGAFMDTADGRALVSGLVAQMQSGAYA